MGSAVDTGNGPMESQEIGKVASPGVIPKKRQRANPMAQEIPVNAAGTRPGDGATKRELFSEETITVLLFPDGALIRLAAAVATGQLVFLTNKNTRKEVVCQVVGKRSYRPTSCYVELQFTEKMPDFWGVEFTEAEVTTMSNVERVGDGRSLEIVETPAAVEDIEYVLEEPAEAPTEREVQDLRGKVEMLRRPPSEISQTEKTSQTNAGTEAKFELETKINDAPAPVVAAPANGDSTIGYAIPWPKDPTMVQAALEREAAPAAERNSHVPMQLPHGASEEQETTNPELQMQEMAESDPEAELLDELLPKPALDFSKVPKRGAADGEEPYSIYKPERAKIEKIALGVLAVVLVGAIGFGVWQLGLLARLKALTAKKTVPVSAGVKQAATAKAADSGTKPAVTADGATAASQPATVDTKSGADTASAETAKKTDETAAAASPSPAPVEAEKRSEVLPKNIAGIKGKKKAAAAEDTVGATAEVAPVAADAPLVPAKLLKTATPVYPPDAMRRFITGNVTLKAEVNEHGKLQNMEVVSGPSALHEAALDALKQYQYSPATRGGKSVASEVKVTMKFWFDP